MKGFDVLARKAVAPAVLMFAVAGCGGSAAPGGPTPAGPTAVVTMTANPNPVAGGLCGANCGNLAGEREALTVLTFRETAGVGATVISGGSQELRNGATGAIIARTTLDPADFVRDGGTARLPASGQLVFRAGVHYPAPHAGVAATFNFAVRMMDDNGHTLTVTLSVPTTG
jgi:hypothetical protein